MSRRCPRLGTLLVAVLISGTACADQAPGAGRDPTTEHAAPNSDAPATALAAAALQNGIDEASAFATSQGIEVSIAVIDRESGTEVSNGAAADVPIFGASLAKLFIADNLLARQRAGEFALSVEDRALLEAMLVASDDDAADSLYARFGAEAIVAEVGQRYGLPSVAPTNEAGSWELTTMSARDVARYYDRFLTSTLAADRDYLVGLLRGIVMIAGDGFDQFFGIPTALPGQTWAVKQGWMCCPRDSSYLHTTGIVGSDNRYTVAILSVAPGVRAPDFATDILSQIAAFVFPPGSIIG